MNVEKHGDDWQVVREGQVLGRFGSSEAAWRFVDRATNEPLNPAEKRAQFFAARVATEEVQRSVKGRRQVRVRNNEAWSWPEDLGPLRDWLAERHVDVGSIKTARQALFMARQLGKLKAKMPRKREDHFPALLAAQRTLCGGTKPQRSKDIPAEKVRDYRLGTFGPASEVRRIDPAAYKFAGQA